MSLVKEKFFQFFKKDFNSKDPGFYNFVQALSWSGSELTDDAWGVPGQEKKKLAEVWEEIKSCIRLWHLVKAMTELAVALVFRLFMEEEEEAETMWKTGEREVVDVHLLKNCLLGEKTGQGGRWGLRSHLESRGGEEILKLAWWKRAEKAENPQGG